MITSDFIDDVTSSGRIFCLRMRPSRQSMAAILVVKLSPDVPSAWSSGDGTKESLMDGCALGSSHRASRVRGTSRFAVSKSQQG